MRAPTFLQRMQASSALAGLIFLTTPLFGEPLDSVEAEDKAPELGAHNPLPLSLINPAPVNSRDVPAAFRRAVPTSVADLKAMQQHITALVPRLAPAVVEVEVGFASGSGVIVSADGLVLTAGHVAGTPSRNVSFVLPDGTRTRGKTLGSDFESDTGLMQITEKGPWPHVPVGELKDAHIGDWVLALGHPGGFDARRSLVVRLGRIIRMAPGLLQSDCPISPGDSGGPLFDMHGRVIGIHTSITSSIAENFHVAITEYVDTWDQLVQAQTVSVGAYATDGAAGCRLTRIDEEGPAFKAGLKVGDLILKVDGREIKSSASFQRWVLEAQPGEVLNVEIKRGERTLVIPLKPERATLRH